MQELEKFNVVIAEPNDGMDDTFQILKDLGCHVFVGPPVSCADQVYSEDQLVELCRDADVFLGMSRETVTRRVLENSKHLRAVCKYGTGVNNIDVDAATELGIIVANAPVHNLTVAEYTIASMLSLLRKIPRNVNYLRNGGWRDPSTTGNELYQKTIGILGFGRIGKQVAKRLMGWDVNLLTYDPVVPREEAALFGAKMVTWDELFAQSDIVTVHLPLIKETEGIIGQREFDLMKPDALLINDARGALIDQEALLRTLTEHRIAGAAIDVFPTEGLDPDYPLLHMDNVILTPHTAGYTHESLRRIAEQATLNCLAALRGEVPEFVFNRAVIPAWKARFGK